MDTVAPLPQLNMSFFPSTDQAGNLWVGVSIAFGPLSFTFGVPADQALDWLKGFDREFRGAQAAAVQEGRKLVLAPHGLLTP